MFGPLERAELGKDFAALLSDNILDVAPHRIVFITDWSFASSGPSPDRHFAMAPLAFFAVSTNQHPLDMAISTFHQTIVT